MCTICTDIMCTCIYLKLFFSVFTVDWAFIFVIVYFQETSVEGIMFDRSL